MLARVVSCASYHPKVDEPVKRIRPESSCRAKGKLTQNSLTATYQRLLDLQVVPMH